MDPNPLKSDTPARGLCARDNVEGVRVDLNELAELESGVHMMRARLGKMAPGSIGQRELAEKLDRLSAKVEEIYIEINEGEAAT